MASQALILNRLRIIINEIATNPDYRRRLCYRPQEALADSGLDGALAPTKLSVDRDCIDIYFDEYSVLGFRAPLNTVIPTQDIRLLTYGVKPIALTYGSEETMHDLGWWAQQHSLIALLSPHEYIPIKDVGKGGYSNLGHRQQLVHTGTSTGKWRGLIVGLDENQVILGWLSLLFGWDAFLGRLLGYPECCTTAFSERWKRALEVHQGDLATMILQASGIGPFDWRSNIFGRYFGYQLIQHFPCRFTCPNTLRLALNYETALRHNEPEHANRVAMILNAPVFYTDYAGVFIFPGARVHVTGNDYILYYDPQQMHATEPDSSLARTLRSLDRIVTSAEEGLLRIGQEGAVGYLVWFNEETITK